MQVFDINVKPGDVRLMDQVADYVYFLNGSAGGGDTTIVVRPESGGDAVYLKPGQAYKFNENERAGRWAITNLKGEAAIIGQVLFAVGMFTDNRVTGSVEVIDGGKARSLSGQAFSSAVLSDSVQGLYSTAQLFNPADSGRRVACSQIIITSTVSGLIKIGWNTQANGGLPPEGVASKLTGGEPGKSKICNAGLVGEPVGFKYLAIYESGAGGGSTFRYEFREPIVILPGFGLNVQHAAIGTPRLQTNFEMVEEAI